MRLLFLITQGEVAIHAYNDFTVVCLDRRSVIDPNQPEHLTSQLGQQHECQSGLFWLSVISVARKFN